MMKKPWILLLLSVLLAACGQPASNTETVPTASAAPTASSTAALNPTGLPASATAVSAPAGCTLQTILEPANPTEVSLFPPVSQEEQQLGPPDAATTIVEYGDFQ